MRPYYPLAHETDRDDLDAMTKAPAKTVRDSKSGKSVAGKVLGTTRDGVRILKPRGNATHFTQKELREAVNRVRAGKQGG